MLDEDNAKKMSSYMRDTFKYYGIATPKRKAVYKSILNKEKNRVIEFFCTYIFDILFTYTRYL